MSTSEKEKQCIDCVHLQPDEEYNGELRWKCDNCDLDDGEGVASFSGLKDHTVRDAGIDGCLNFTSKESTATPPEPESAVEPSAETVEPAKDEAPAEVADATADAEKKPVYTTDQLLDAARRKESEISKADTECRNLEHLQSQLRSEANGYKKPIAEFRNIITKFARMTPEMFLEMEREKREAEEEARKRNAKPLLDKAEEMANAWRNDEINTFDLPEQDRGKLLVHWKTCGEVADWLAKDWPEKKEGCNHQAFRDRVRAAIDKKSGVEAGIQAELEKVDAEKAAATEPAPDAYVPALNPRRYILQTEGKENRVLFVDGDSQFTTFYRYPNGDKKRFTAKDFTWRDTFAEAQADLDVYAANAGLMIDGAEKKCPKNPSQKQVDKFLNAIDTLLGDERYCFADDTLAGIRDWVAEHKHFTPAQFDAVVNIEESVNF